jgi:hypothetical protein
MKRFVPGLLAAICFASSPERTPQLAPVILFTQTQQPVPATVLGTLQAEVGDILGHAGFRFLWYAVEDAEAAGTSAQLAVVTFRGTCDVLGPRLAGHVENQALGFTNVTDGEILPFTTIDCDRTRDFLSAALLHLPQSERAEAFGRALGRILAHELYHIFANTQHHGRAGVAKESYTVTDLLCADFELEQREFELLRSGRAYSILARAAIR